MAWEECVTSIKNSYKPTPAQDVSTVVWSTIPQAALDNDTFKNGNPMFLICPDRHCVDYVNTTPSDHALCQCKDINGNPIPNCTPPSALYPEKASVCFNVKTGAYNSNSSRACTNQGNDWYQLTCYCCCSCFANGTLIAVPGARGVKKIEDIQKGVDKVYTAKISRSGPDINLEWGVSRVSFSQGTGPDGHQSNMIFVIFNDPDDKDGTYRAIIVTPDHLFLLSDGSLKRADQLVPGHDPEEADFLVNKKGKPVKILEVSSGEYTGGVHHISTENKMSDGIDGHLLLSEGIVSADFELQINPGKFISDKHKDAPKIGTEAYVKKNVKLTQVHYAKYQVADFENKKVKELKRSFFAFGEHTQFIPATAATYLSKQQEKDVDGKLNLIHFTELPPKTAIMNYLIRLFKGFFPDIKIYFDSGRVEANAYAFVNQYNERVIVISGGLARIADLNLEGMAMIVGHMVSCVQQSAPLNNQGYTSVGMADYYSMMLLQTVFYTQAFNEITAKGINQLQKGLFDNISDKDKIYKSDPYHPSIDTRLDAIDTGINGNYPPPGIGGPEFHALELLNVTSAPPVCDDTSFITDDIDPAASMAVFEALTEHGILLSGGVIAADFSIDADLSFLFPDKSGAEKTLLTEEVRYKLLHPVSTATLEFNLEMSDARVQLLDDFEFEPIVTVKEALVDPGDSKIVHLRVSDLKRETQYTLTISSQLLSRNGSTMNPKKSSFTFKAG